MSAPCHSPRPVNSVSAAAGVGKSQSRRDLSLGGFPVLSFSMHGIADLLAPRWGSSWGREPLSAFIQVRKALVALGLGDQRLQPLDIDHAQVFSLATQ
jgi:hypothetical protein